MPLMSILSLRLSPSPLQDRLLPRCFSAFRTQPRRLQSWLRCRCDHESAARRLQLIKAASRPPLSDCRPQNTAALPLVSGKAGLVLSAVVQNGDISHMCNCIFPQCPEDPTCALWPRQPSESVLWDPQSWQSRSHQENGLLIFHYFSCVPNAFLPV